MRLTEQHIIKRSHSLWKQFDELCFLSKNLYNASLYDVRQNYFRTGKHKTWMTQRPEFVKSNNPDYRALPAKVAGTVLQSVGRNFNSFFGALKSKRAGTNNRTVRIPKYLDKNGRQVLEFPKDTISRNKVQLSHGLWKHTVCKTSKIGFTFISQQENVDIVRVVPKSDHYLLEVIYTVADTDLVPDNGRYASVDLGVNNLAAVYYNCDSPQIYNGRAIKSINQYFNKKKAKLQSKLGGEQHTSNKLRALSRKRTNKLNWELHNISSMIVNHLVSTNISMFVIGSNKNWKQDINIGKRNNQNFVSIPFSKFIQQLQYKCRRAGIKVVLTEESYTSKCSFIDRESVTKHKKYAGRRVKRGLFVSANGNVINADINGAANIMRKVVPDEQVYEGIEAVAIQPVMVNLS